MCMWTLGGVAKGHEKVEDKNQRNERHAGIADCTFFAEAGHKL